MPDYDRQVLQRMADELYAKAQSTRILGAISYGLAGGVAGAVLGYPSGSSTVLFVLFALVAGAIGWASASTRAFLLEVEAQKILCMAEIERNTGQPAR